VVVPASLSFVRAPAHPDCPGSKGRKTVVGSTVLNLNVTALFSFMLQGCSSWHGLDHEARGM